jgi:pyrroloquinoline quinone biosynthesis protein E
MAMLAELTHRCPLKCPYCSNPLELARKSEELDTATWIDLFRQAAAMGVLQVHLSGGEPAARRDLPEIVSGAVEAGLYTNLVTSGVGLTEKTFADLVARGLDHVQLSVQGVDAKPPTGSAATRAGSRPRCASRAGSPRPGVPLTVNAVMHRQNLDRLEETIALAHRLGARRLEIAHTQYHGWAYRNRHALMPTIEQVKAASAVAKAATERLKGVLAIDYVTPGPPRALPEALHGRLGPRRAERDADRQGAALPCGGEHHGAAVRDREGPPPRRHLGERPRLRRLSRDRTGCRSPAAAATGARPIGAAAAARPSPGPATPRRWTRPARSRPSMPACARRPRRRAPRMTDAFAYRAP